MGLPSLAHTSVYPNIASGFSASPRIRTWLRILQRNPGFHTPLIPTMNSYVRSREMFTATRHPKENTQDHARIHHANPIHMPRKKEALHHATFRTRHKHHFLNSYVRHNNQLITVIASMSMTHLLLECCRVVQTTEIFRALAVLDGGNVSCIHQWPMSSAQNVPFVFLY